MVSAPRLLFRGAIETLRASGIGDDHIVAIDSAGSAVAEARADGLTAVLGDATRTPVLTQAQVELARSVIVACNRDDTATLVTLTARELNPSAHISAAVKEAENAHLLSQSGAATVIVSSTAAGRLLGLSTTAPRAVAVLEDILVAGQGLDIAERPATTGEFGGPPQTSAFGIPVAVVRDDRRLSFDDPEFASVEAGDTIVCITGSIGR